MVWLTDNLSITKMELSTLLLVSMSIILGKAATHVSITTLSMMVWRWSKTWLPMLPSMVLTSLPTSIMVVMAWTTRSQPHVLVIWTISLYPSVLTWLITIMVGDSTCTSHGCVWQRFICSMQRLLQRVMEVPQRKPVDAISLPRMLSMWSVTVQVLIM